MASLVDPKSISEAAIKQQLLDFLAAKPDGSIWQDFFRDASSGGTIVELLSGVSALLLHHSIVGRREAYLYSASQRTSVIAIAEILGYSAFRGQKKHWTLNVTPNFSGSFAKFSIIGSAKGLDIVNLSVVTATNGVPVNLNVVVGDLKSESLIIASGADRLFSFISPNVSEDFRLLLEGVEVDTSTNLLDLNEDKFVTLSNPVGAIDVVDLNTGTDIFDTGDTLLLEFIEFTDQFAVVIADVTFTGGGTTNTIEADDTEPFLDVETITSIRSNAPLDHEVKKLIRGRDDYKKLVKQFTGATLISSGGQDVTPSVVEVTYLQDDLTALLFSEKTALIAFLSSARPFGTEPPTISDPVSIPLDVTVTISLRTGIDVPGDLNTQVTAIVQDNYQHDLEILLDLENIESLVNELTNNSSELFIKSTRVSITTAWAASTAYNPSAIVVPLTANGRYYKSLPNVETKWAASTVYAEGDLIIATATDGYGNLFQAFTIINPGASASTEPTWDASAGSPGDTVVDNDVTWKNVGTIIPLWAISTSYAVDDIVSPNVFDSTETPVFAGGGLDDMTAGGTFTEFALQEYYVEIQTTGAIDTFRWSKDGGITFEASGISITTTEQALDDGVTITFGAVTGHTATDNWTFDAFQYYFKRVANVEGDWQGSTVYALNDRRVPTNGFADNQHCFEVSARQGDFESDGVEPVWPTTLGATIVDNNVTWKNIGVIVRRWQPSRAYSSGDIVVSLSPTAPARMFEVTTPGTSGSSEPSWDTGVGNTTPDGGGALVWTTRAIGDSHGATEPVWQQIAGYLINDFTSVWETVLAGVTDPAEPTFPTIEDYAVDDNTIVWQDIGIIADVVQLAWNEYFVIAVTVVAT